jgi:hypothetical protein
MPRALQQYGVTEEEWEQFAHEAEESMRENDMNCHFTCRQYCFLPILPPVLWCFVIGLLEEYKVQTGSDISIDHIIAVSNVIMVPYVLAVFFFFCGRLCALGKALHHDIDEISQRVFAPHKILAYHEAGRGGQSPKPELIRFTYYGDEESEALLEDGSPPAPRSKGSVRNCLICLAVVVFFCCLEALIGTDGDGAVVI